VAAPGLEEFGGPEDEEGGGAVPELEGADTGEERSQATLEDGPDLKPDPGSFPGLRRFDMPNGVEDGRGGEQTRDDRQPDRPAGAHQGDEGDGEDRPADGAEVVHGPLEAIGAAVDGRVDDVGEEGIASGDA
jgi:hypothetical protein